MNDLLSLMIFLKVQPERDVKAPEDLGSFQDKRNFFQNIGKQNLYIRSIIE